jgi:Ser/Thr protein kinase RdoA (MazF antagonist)
MLPLAAQQRLAERLARLQVEVVALPTTNLWLLARRWDDPAFPASFPFFNTQHYWQDHILSLREQAAALDEPPLRWLR